MKSIILALLFSFNFLTGQNCDSLHLDRKIPKLLGRNVFAVLGGRREHFDGNRRTREHPLSMNDRNTNFTVEFKHQFDEWNGISFSWGLYRHGLGAIARAECDSTIGVISKRKYHLFSASYSRTLYCARYFRIAAFMGISYLRGKEVIIPRDFRAFPCMVPPTHHVEQFPLENFGVSAGVQAAILLPLHFRFLFEGRFTEHILCRKYTHYSTFSNFEAKTSTRHLALFSFGLGFCL